MLLHHDTQYAIRQDRLCNMESRQSTYANVHAWLIAASRRHLPRIASCVARAHSKQLKLDY